MRKHSLSLVACGILAITCLVGATAPVHAALVPYDPPTLECVAGSATLSSLTLKICAGPSGAPAGLTVQWKKVSDWETSGWDNPCALSLSGQPSLQHPGKSRWELLPGECEEIIIGDINFDETGVGGDGCAVEPLECGEDYIFRAFAHAGRGRGRSEFTDKLQLNCSTRACPGDQCTFTMTYWKTHGSGTCHQGANPDAWPPSALPMTIGTVVYTSASQLCAALNVPALANGLVSLGHQVISARLNLANGATSCTDLDNALAAADALIGGRPLPPNPPQPQFLSTALTSPTTLLLNTYNGGALCSPNCFGGQAPSMRSTGARGDGEQMLNGDKTTWGKLKTLYR